MDYKIRKRTEEDVNEFITWTYGGIYSFYDNNIQQEKIDGFIQSVNSESEFSVVDENNNLIGNCEFYYVDDDGDEIIAVGVQMKPSLTGQGNGFDFVHTVVEQGRELLNFNHLELAVVDFNKRAIRTYEKIGFKKKGRFDNEIRGNTYSFIIMAKDWR
jgi:ribosomal-protein-alanine N-acetyltransferase